MTLQELRAMVMADRFNPNEAGDIDNWINYVGGLIWNADEWTFRQATATVATNTAGTVTTSIPNFGTSKGLWLADGTRLTPLRDPADYYDRYFGTSSVGSTQPEAYTIVGTSILVGAAVAVTGMRLLYDTSWTQLVDDADVPALPVEVHLGLGMGAAKWGLALRSDPSWLGLDGAIPEVMGTLRANYLESVDDKQGRQSPAYRAVM